MGLLCRGPLAGRFFSTSTLHIATGAGSHAVDFRGEDQARYAHDLILSRLVEG